MNTLYKKVNRGAVVISLLLALLLAVAPVFTAKIAYAAERDPSWLEPVTIEIVGWTAGEPIDYTNELSIKVGFKVPVEGDGVVEYFNFNDTVTLPLSQYFSFLVDTTLDLTANDGKVIGHVTLKNDAQGRAIAEIVFDESPEVFEIEDVVYSNVFAGFNATLTFNEDGWEDADEESNEWYLDKDVEFILPGDTITETISKNGQLNEDGNGIVWEITITRMDNANPPQHQSLAGFTFRDELDGVGTFKPGSFSVKHSGSTEVSVDDSDVLTSEEGKQVLVYEIPAGFGSPLTITFETDLPSGILVNGGDIKNVGQLGGGDKDPIQDDDTVTIDPPVISKEGWVSGEYGDDDEDKDVYLNGSRLITWYVEVDSKGLTLYDLEIKDAIDSDLVIESISWEIWTLSSDDPPVGSWVESTETQHQWTGAPTDNVYEIGDFNGKGRLAIVVKVPAPDEGDISLVEKTYTNEATVTWKGKDGSGTGSSSPDAEVGVGYNVITKKRGGDSAYPPYNAIPWEISVNLKGQGDQNYADDLAVYDLIIHDSSTTEQQIFAAKDVNGDPITVWPADFTADDIGSGGIPRNDGHKFEGLRDKDEHLTFSAIDLYLYDGGGNATHIGTLIKVTGLLYNQANNFSFKTKIVDPDKLWGNDLANTEADNWVSLYKGNSQASSANATTKFNIRILDKDMLMREEVDNDHDENATISPNNRTDQKANAFHYGHKEIIFRLNINGAGIDFTDPDLVLENGFGAVTVADKLPPGWVFVPFSDGSDFLIYKANPGTSYLTATGTPLSPSSIPGGLTYELMVAVNVNTDESQETATFMFGGLKDSYVVLVKAAPSEGKLEELLGENKTITETNTASIFTENLSFKGFDEKQQFDVDGSVLKKTVKMPSKPGGVAIWTVDYTPLGLEFGIGFLDTLPEGLDLRTDSSGQIDWGTEAEPNITISELQLKEDGSGAYEVVANSTLWGQDLVDWAEYSPGSRELTIYFPDPEKAYRVTYLTDITGVLGYLKNKVQLLEGLVDGVEDKDGVLVDDSSGWAIMDLSGFAMIRKTQSDGKTNLAGAVFTLFNTGSDGLASSVRAVRTTGSDGIVRFLGLPTGTYILRETEQPADYKENTLDYRVVVGPAPTFSVTINGQAGPFNANSPLTIKNYLKEERIGKLSVEKEVAGTIGDPDELFTFELTFRDATGQDLAGSFYYIGSGVPDGTIVGGGQIQLKHGQSITVIGLPEGTDYWVTELEANRNGYVTVPDGDNGTIADEVTSEVVFTNTRNDGSLNLLKLVTGNAGDKDKAFTFKVWFYWNEVLDTTSYPFSSGDGVLDGNIASGDEIQLAHGQSITINDVPEGTWYEVEEVEADEDGYITTTEREEGEIEIEGPQTVVFTNSKTLGELSIAKTVEGNAGDPDAKFTFIVNLFFEPEITITSIFRPFGNNGGNGAVYDYVGFGGAPDGTISSGDAIELAHGQRIVIKGLPLGSTYEVIEVEADQDGYITESVDETGGFTLEDFRQYARFLNTKNLGELTIKKIVNGISGDKTRKFTFELTLTGAEGREVEGKFAYKGTGVADGAIESGGTVRLADGESIVIQGLPIGSTYKVVEHEADKDDYITTVIGDTGSFKVDDFEKSAQFTNTNNRALESDEDIPKTGDTSNNTWLAVFVTSIILLLGLVTADFYLRRQRNTQ